MSAPLNEPFIHHPRRWLALWAAALVLGFIGVFGLDRLFLAYSAQLRASDYRTFVAEAAALADAGQLDEAFIPIQTALRLAPEAPEVHLMHGHLHYRRQQWEEALFAYRRALQHDSPEIGARLNAVWAYIQLGRYRDAIALGEVSIRTGFDSPVMQRYLAEAYYRGHDFAGAIPYLLNAVEGFPNDLYLWEHIIQCARQTGDEALEQRARDRVMAIQGQLDSTAGAGP